MSHTMAISEKVRTYIDSSMVVSAFEKQKAEQNKRNRIDEGVDFYMVYKGETCWLLCYVWDQLQTIRTAVFSKYR